MYTEWRYCWRNKETGDESNDETLHTLLGTTAHILSELVAGYNKFCPEHEYWIEYR